MSKNSVLESVMSDIKKADCIAVIQACEILGISRGTLVTYMRAIGITQRRFSFDTKVYITNDDLQRIRQFIAENK